MRLSLHLWNLETTRNRKNKLSRIKINSNTTSIRKTIRIPQSMMEQEFINFIATVIITLAFVFAYVAWIFKIPVLAWIFKIPNANPPIKFHVNCPGPQNLTLHFKGTKIEDSNQKVFHKNGGHGNIAYYFCQKYHYKNLPLHLVRCGSHFNLDTINNVVVKHVDLINHNHL